MGYLTKAQLNLGGEKNLTVQKPAALYAEALINRIKIVSYLPLSSISSFK